MARTNFNWKRVAPTIVREMQKCISNHRMTVKDAAITVLADIQSNCFPNINGDEYDRAVPHLVEDVYYVYRNKTTTPTRTIARGVSVRRRGEPMVSASPMGGLDPNELVQAVRLYRALKAAGLTV